MLFLPPRKHHILFINVSILTIFRNFYTVVGIATGYGLDDGRVKNFLFSTSSRQAMGSTQPPIQCVPGALSPGIKRPGRETDHSPPTNAEVKNGGAIYPLPRTPSWLRA
jgi:hypothetical protein